MTAAEFLRRVKKQAKRRHIPCRFVPDEGKGSHGRLYFGDRLTTVQDLRRELPAGTLRAMLGQIGLTMKDLF